MGCDIGYTNHADADQDQGDMDHRFTLLDAAGVNFIMGVLGADDIMRNYQSTSFHDALYLRNLLGLRRAPEFETWLETMLTTDAQGALLGAQPYPPLLEGSHDWMGQPERVVQYSSVGYAPAVHECPYCSRTYGQQRVYVVAPGV